MKTLFAFAAVGMLAIVIISCEYNAVPSNAITNDEELFEEISGDDFKYFRNGALLSPNAQSPHGSFKLKFNNIAWEALDANGELPRGSSFPENSVIVKEVHSGGTILLYAVMKKSKNDLNAGESWLWSEYYTNGSVAFAIGRKGNGCISCHSNSPQRDLVRVFDLH